MNSLSRLLGLGLFVVLAALVALLTAAAWRGARAANSVSGEVPALTASSLPAATQSRNARLGSLPLRVALPLAATSLVLAAALLASLAFPRTRSAGSTPPFSAARAEINSLEHLAKASVAQTAALARERDVRARAEADAQLTHQHLNRSLEEKVRLGRDLHDGLIQSLYATGLIFESARQKLPHNPDDAVPLLDRGLHLLNTSIRDVRTCIRGLVDTPAGPHAQSFATALHATLDDLRADHAVRFDVQLDGDAAQHIHDSQFTDLVQITHEAVSNALRHGQATQVTVRLHEDQDRHCLLVQDNGHGFDVASEDGKGNGIANLRARAGALQGDLRITSQPGQGTRVVLTFPSIPPS